MAANNVAMRLAGGSTAWHRLKSVIDQCGGWRWTFCLANNREVLNAVQETNSCKGEEIRYSEWKQLLNCKLFLINRETIRFQLKFSIVDN